MLGLITRWSLTRQLVVGSLLLVTLIMALFLVITSAQTRTLMLKEVAESQHREVSALAAQLNTSHANVMSNTEMLAQVFQELYPSTLEFDESATVKIGRYESPLVRHQGQQVNLNFDNVDKFARMTGGNATVFIRYGDDFLRVTTSLKNQQGNRAIGTLLGQNHPGYKTLMSGKAYIGEAHLFGTDYMTKYSPVVAANGRVVAILYVGLPITKVMKDLRDNLLALNIGESGYLGLVYSGEGKTQGKLIAHRTQQDKQLDAVYGSSLGNKVTEMLKRPSGHFTSRLEGRDALVSYEKIGSGAWTVFAVSYQDEFVGEINALVGRLAMLSLVATVVMSLVLGLFLKRSLLPLKDVRNRMGVIGQGDLTYRFNKQIADSSKNELD